MKNQSGPAAECLSAGSPSLESLLDSIIDVVCTFDGAGKFLYVSAASRRLWGYESEELVGRHSFQFMVPEDIEKTVRIFEERTHECTTSNFSNRYFRKDGTVVDLIWSARWDAEEGILYCVARDGSEKKIIEDRLEQAQRMARITSFEYDALAQTFEHTNTLFHEICGLDPAAFPVITQQVYRELVHPDDREALFREFFRSENILQSQHDYRILRPDGNIIFVHHQRRLLFDEEGRHIRTLVTIQDITDRKIAELALQQKEQRFRFLVENGLDLIGIIDSAGNYLYVADNIRKILHLEASDMVHKNVFSFIHPEDHPYVLRSLQAAKEEEQVHLEPFRFSDGKGQWRWVETTVSNFLGQPGIDGLVVNARDVTERKLQDDRIRRLSLVAGASQNAILLTDLEWNVTWVNNAFLELSEFSEAEVVGRYTYEIFGGANLDLSANRRIGEMLLRGRHIQRELEFVSRSGRRFWIEIQVQPVRDETGRPLQYLVISRDISERKAAEKKLELSEKRFKTLVQHGSDIIVIIAPDSTFKYVSDNIRHILGYEPEFLIGKSAFDMLHPDDLKAAFNGVQNIIDNNMSNKWVQHRFRNSRGEWIWLESKGTNHLKDALVDGILVNARDIHERVTLEQQLEAELFSRQKEITAAVIKAQELERSQLGLELHDNVNQVLTTVKLYNEMLLSGIGNEKELLIKSTQYIQDCINEIRSISKRLSAPTLGNITLRDSICELVESINLTNRLEIRFRSSGLEDYPVGQDLHLTVYRIVQEGVNNIIKYAAATLSTIEIRVADNHLCVRIEDNGKGFDPDARNNGIGLTNMRTRAENLNGRFSIRSAPGAGCRIEICFDL